MTEKQFYTLRKWENGYIRAKKGAPVTYVTSRRTAKKGNVIWQKNSKVVDMNFRIIYPQSKH